MKIFANIMKVVAALAAVAGVVYVIATYGDKIVAWAKKMLGLECCCDDCDECCCEECECCEEAEEEAEEATDEADFEEEVE